MNDLILHERLIDNLHKNAMILGHILQDIAQKDAARWCDGANGWSVLDVMCHLRDYEDIFRERGELMLANKMPTFPIYDHLAMVVDRAYHAQSLPTVLADFTASREKTAVFFQTLSPTDWLLTGQHVEQGAVTMTALAAHIVWHDSNHIEQISRVLAAK